MMSEEKKARKVGKSNQNTPYKYSWYFLVFEFTIGISWERLTEAVQQLSLTFILAILHNSRKRYNTDKMNNRGVAILVI